MEFVFQFTQISALTHKKGFLLPSLATSFSPLAPSGNNLSVILVQFMDFIPRLGLIIPEANQELKVPQKHPQLGLNYFLRTFDIPDAEFCYLSIGKLAEFPGITQDIILTHPKEPVNREQEQRFIGNTFEIGSHMVCPCSIRGIINFLQAADCAFTKVSGIFLHRYMLLCCLVYRLSASAGLCPLLPASAGGHIIVALIAKRCHAPIHGTLKTAFLKGIPIVRKRLQRLIILTEFLLDLP
jgi:hypothetical protein